MTGLRAFWALIERGRAPTLLTSALEAAVGRDAFAELRAAGVLARGDQATRYPCDGPDGDGCPRRVVANAGDGAHPFVAVCGRVPPACAPVLLSEADLEQTRVSEEGLVRALQRALALDGASAADGSAFPDTLLLGRGTWGGATREVFVCLRPWDAGFPTFLTARRAARAHTLVLVPTRRWVPVAVADAHGPGERVELVVLEDVLALRDGALVVAQAEAVATPAPMVGPFFTVLDGAGTRQVPEAEYRALLARRGEYDLFLDLTTTVAAGGHAGSMRDGTGAACDAFLSVHEAGAIAELAERRSPARPTELVALRGVNHPDKVIERARRKLDVNPSRYEWRVIQTLRADGPAAKTFFFNPPDGFRFAVVRPVRTP